MDEPQPSRQNSTNLPDNRAEGASMPSLEPTNTLPEGQPHYTDPDVTEATPQPVVFTPTQQALGSPTVNTPIVSDATSTSSRTHLAKRNVLLYALIIVVVVAAVIVGGLVLYHKGPFKNTSQTTKATEISNKFVYDITHDKATAAYGYVYSGSSVLSNKNSFGTGVEQLSRTITGSAKLTSSKSDNEPNTSGSPGAPAEIRLDTAYYDIQAAPYDGFRNSGTIMVILIYIDSQWKVDDVSIDGSQAFQNIQLYSSVSDTSDTDATGSSTSAGSSGTSASSSSCPSASGTGLVCYNVSASGSLPAFSVLFLPNSTTQNTNGVADISPPGGDTQSSLQFATLNSYTDVPCTERPDHTHAFSFTSNGNPEDACVLIGTEAALYYTDVSVNGITYSVSIRTPSSSPINMSAIETIFSSVKSER